MSTSTSSMSSLTPGTQETQPFMDVAEILEKNEAFVGEFVPLSNRQKATLRRVFVPALVLLKSINDICALGDRPTEHGPPPDAHESPEKKFQTFVNKVAQICDSLPKGSTVTACVVLEQENGRVLYLFASNNRKTKSIREMATFVVSVFDVLKKNISAPPGQKESDQVLNDRLLRMVLAFNHVRIRSYISALATHIRTCIKRCATGDEEDAVILENLESLLGAIPVAGQERRQKSEECKDMSSHHYDLRTKNQRNFSLAVADDVSRLILAIQSHQQTPAQQLIQKRALALKSDKGNCWALARHAAGRLVSYQYAVETLTIAHHVWADTPLFLEYDIGFLHSSKAGHEPLVEQQTGLRSKPLTADEIINRMTSNRPDQERYKAFAESLQMDTTAGSTSTAAAGGERKLDAAIAEQWNSGMASRVHSEVLLLDYLQRTPGRTKAHRFFRGMRYIGASKPSCRLCRYYFDTCAPEVATRATHNNVYYRWRQPDTYRFSGDPLPNGEGLTPAETQWRDTINQIKALVCRDVFRLLETQVGDAPRMLDSNTYTERIRLSSGAGSASLGAPSVAEVDMLSGALRGMEI
ncbi:hypothetical protein B0I37DRAFT_196859 [Chaetomium sp. MPI-CAGE-AT-0009]|nr:hypothetical protein B0I37DRAFT_196859 [Chaetomium sp. MPI-CAGE-AT-0009]